jgi:hypothetical protein
MALCPPFKARDDGLSGVHSARHLLLREARLDARLDEFGHQGELVFQSVVGFAILGAPSRLREHLIGWHEPDTPRLFVFRLAHSTSFARSIAKEISRLGVFWVFLVNTRTTMMRRPDLVT